MDVEIVGGCEGIDYFPESENLEQNTDESSFHEKIYSNPHSHLRLSYSNSPFMLLQASCEDQKIKSTFLKAFQPPIVAHAGGSVETGISISWGGKDGTTMEGYAEVDVYDDRGNHVDIKVQQDSNGQGNFDASIRHESEDKGSGGQK